MKIAIISDIHDNLPNLLKALDWFKKEKIDKIICCGDVTNNETLEDLSTNFLEEIILVKGNADNWYEEELEKFKNITYLGRSGGVVVLDGVKIGICHEPYLSEKIIKNEKPHILFCGHTHKPWEEDKNGVLMINPGTLGGMFQDGTFAMYDTSKGELKLKRVN